MEMITIATIVAIVILILYWGSRNAVWGGATLGIIVGLIVAFLTKDWSRLVLIFTVGTFIGALFEWIGKVASKLNRNFK